MSTPRKALPKVVLEPLNLHNADEFDDLLRQRVLCGWSNTPAYIEKWRDFCSLGQKSLFWIHLPPGSDAKSTDARSSQGHRRIGHIGFQSIPDIGEADSDPDLAKLDKTVLMISTFFVLQEHRGGGIGRAAMEALEAMTQVAPYGSPNCRALTLHTLSRKYTDEDGDGSPDAWRASRAVWEKIGAPTRARGSSNEDWYNRMGYVKWKDEPRYHEQLLDGTKFQLIAAFMRKEV